MTTRAVDSLVTRRNTATNPYATTQSDERNSSISTYASTLPQNQNTDELNTRKTDYNTEDLYEQYKKNPMKLISVLGLNFTDKQLKEIKKLFKTEDGVKAFLNVAQNKNLNENDILAISKEVMAKETGFWDKTCGFFGTLWNDGIDGALEYMDSSKAYNAKNMANKVNDIKKVRDDFDSETYIDIVNFNEEYEEISDDFEYFLLQDGNNEYLYTEDDLKLVLDYMKKNPEYAEKLKEHAFDLEKITIENGEIKYDGTTILKVSIRMTEAPDLADTMLNVAQKTDMTDEILDTTTENLFINPEMEESINYMVTQRNEDGTDRFSAQNILTSSTYLLDKKKEFCQNYFNNIVEVTQNSSYNGDEILNITQQVTENPSQKETIYTKYNIEIENNSNDYQYDGNNISENTDYGGNYSEDNALITQSDENQLNPSFNFNLNNNSTINQNNNTSNEIISNDENTITINGESHNKDEVKGILQRKFGYGIADILIEKIEANPDYLSEIKSFSGNSSLLKAYIENPEKVLKLKREAKMASNTQLEQMFNIATNEERLENLLELNKIYNTATAISLAVESRDNHSENATRNLLQSNTISVDDKKIQLEGVIKGNQVKTA